MGMEIIIVPDPMDFVKRHLLTSGSPALGTDGLVPKEENQSIHVQREFHRRLLLPPGGPRVGWRGRARPSGLGVVEDPLVEMRGLGGVKATRVPLGKVRVGLKTQRPHRRVAAVIQVGIVIVPAGVILRGRSGGVKFIFDKVLRVVGSSARMNEERSMSAKSAIPGTVLSMVLWVMQQGGWGSIVFIISHSNRSCIRLMVASSRRLRLHRWIARMVHGSDNRLLPLRGLGSRSGGWQRVIPAA